MRVALAGLGSAARRGHLPALLALADENTVTLVGAADPDPHRRATLATVLPDMPMFQSAQEMLTSVSCDLLVIATDPGSHAELAALGLEVGSHVLCEKPLVLTHADYRLIATAHARRADLGLIGVHQYRYSPTWTVMLRAAQLAARLHLPFSLRAEVHRETIDPLASSPWRADIDLSGGMLADHGVHFLALAWMIDQQLEVLAGSRRLDCAGEHSGASVRIGSGLLAIQASTGNPARRTHMTLSVANAELVWSDGTLEIVVAGRTLLKRAVSALAQRSHVDALYQGLYRDLLRNLARPAWRAHRTAEALAVARTLLTLLEAAPLQPLHEGACSLR